MKSLSRFSGFQGRFVLLSSIFFCLFLGPFFTREAGAQSFGYRKSITVNSSQVPSPQTDFPMLVSISSDSDLASHVTQSNGGDILFRALDDVTCGGSAPCTLYHEIESYTVSSGEATLVAWVKVPYVTTGTVIYMYYGNPSITADPSSTWAKGVWDSNYKGVWHLGQASGSTTADSTTNGNTGTASSSFVDFGGFVNNGKIGPAGYWAGADSIY